MGVFSWKVYKNGDQNKPFNPWFCERADRLLPFSLSNQAFRADERLDLALIARERSILSIVSAS